MNDKKTEPQAVEFETQHRNADGSVGVTAEQVKTEPQSASELNREKIERLTLMADGNQSKWDLSDNDQNAIRYALAEIASLRQSLSALQAENRNAIRERDAYHKALVTLSMGIGNPCLAPDDGRTFSDELVKVTLDKLTALQAERDEIIKTLNLVGSVTHGPLSESSDKEQIIFAIRDLQECYGDAARARNGSYFKTQDQLRVAREALEKIAAFKATADPFYAVRTIRTLKGIAVDSLDELARKAMEATR